MWHLLLAELLGRQDVLSDERVQQGGGLEVDQRGQVVLAGVGQARRGLGRQQPGQRRGVAVPITSPREL